MIWGSQTFEDYNYIPVSSGYNGVLSTPGGSAQVFQGVVGSDLSANIALSQGVGTWGTLTISSPPNVTSAIWGSGSPTVLFTISGLTVGKLYRLRVTPTISGQVPTFTPTSGVQGDYVASAWVNSVQNNIYFVASATTAVWTALSSTTSTWSTASTTLYEYSRAVMAREFAYTSMQTVVFDWFPPRDWDNTQIIEYSVFGVITQTPPTNGQIVNFSLSAYAVDSSDSLSMPLGAGLVSSVTFDATYAQYDWFRTPATGTLSIDNSGWGKKVRLFLSRQTVGNTYNQSIGVVSVGFGFSRTIV
jgi:hypothetical protein